MQKALRTTKMVSQVTPSLVSQVIPPLVALFQLVSGLECFFFFFFISQGLTNVDGPEEAASTGVSALWEKLFLFLT